ncbi:putative prophage repressor [Desulforamulus reducens MI-1]|uniref:Putative prophage repressor n=1 Tax=Desulforamulus reducens (strain ATCC BAA-1160 / DSM 100696 / MI-1) TaxID=349161 RepID=A4J3R4_DESRM|nr:XRE family transcriptional regulator [Desulforamulus reducens]ABO49717.1 putative prophage repressor [Desulforamulus reducens MI-1]
MGRYFDKGLFSKRLLELMVDNNDTTYSLGEHLHLSNATISRYTTGDIAPKIPTIEKIAEKYGVNPAWLTGTEGASKYVEKTMPSKKIPIIGAIAAGIPILAQENIDGYEYIPDNVSIDFCLRVKGDSMIGARILDGDIVYIRKQPQVENGEIAAVIIDNEEATLKRIYALNGSVILRAENPNYPDKVFSKKDMKQISIIGKAIFFKSEVR